MKIAWDSMSDEEKLELCKEWWRSPDGRKSIKNSFYPSEKYKEVQDDKVE